MACLSAHSARPMQPIQPTRLLDKLSEQSQANPKATGNSLLVLVREVIAHRAGIGYQRSGKVLAFCCMPDPLGWCGFGSDTHPCETSECIQIAVKLALYDALVFSCSRDGYLDRPICPPTLLRVKRPVVKDGEICLQNAGLVCLLNAANHVLCSSVLSSHRLRY